MAKSFNRKQINDRFFSLFTKKKKGELAALLGVGSSAISEWSAGRKQVPWDKLAYAVELSGKSWDWILTGEDKGSASPGNSGEAAVDADGGITDVFSQLQISLDALDRGLTGGKYEVDSEKLEAVLRTIEILQEQLADLRATVKSLGDSA
ncbi:MAG: helix-turn-helix domain containing protein [Planctomycetaceae bacterium]|nr:helix-turn-helix domain containing protein [Planctomycetaceae bacterium]